VCHVQMLGRFAPEVGEVTAVGVGDQTLVVQATRRLDARGGGVLVNLDAFLRIGDVVKQQCVEFCDEIGAQCHWKFPEIYCCPLPVYACSD
jgi:hypothetical protein